MLIVKKETWNFVLHIFVCKLMNKCNFDLFEIILKLALSAAFRKKKDISVKVIDKYFCLLLVQKVTFCAVNFLPDVSTFEKKI